MAYSNGGGDRQMFTGNWTCSQCGNPITELPFEPDPSRVDQLKCRDCHKARRPGGGFGGGERRERQMFQGNWTCSKCGTAITELPFEPDASRLDQLKCRDCHKADRPSFSGGRY